MSGETRVLVTGAGGPAAVSFLRAVEAASEIAGPVEFFAVDIDPHAAGLFLVDRPHRSLVPRGDDPGFVDALLGLCRLWQIDVLVPTVDSEMLPVVGRQDDFEAAGTTVLACSEPTLSVCLDKWVFIQACAAAVDVPQTALLDAAFDPEAWQWPSIVKPRIGSGSRGVEIIASSEALSRRPELRRDAHLIMQELLPGVEHSIDVLAYRSGQIAATVPRTRLKVDSGIAVAGYTDTGQALQQYAQTVASAIGLTSVANVQVKQDRDGNPRVLEVNPRFPGSMPLTVEAGVNMPALALADAIGRPVPEDVPFRAIAMVRTWQETFVEIEDYTVPDRITDLSETVVAP